MTLEYANKKIIDAYKDAIRRIEMTEKQIEISSGWAFKSVWSNHLDQIVAEYRAAADMVVEIYIEITSGNGWRELSNMRFDLEKELRKLVDDIRD